MRRSLLTAAAASALALSIGFGPASAFSPIGKTADPEGLLQKVQRSERGPGAGKGKGTGEGVRSRDRGPRAEFRSGKGDGDRRRHGRRGGDFGIYVGPGYGYVSDCEWLRRRAGATGSSYWWRRYRACIN